MKKIFKYFFLTPLFFLLLLQLTPITLGADFLDILNTSINSLKDTVIFPVTGGSLGEKIGENENAKQEVAKNEITDLECPSGSQKMYSEDGKYVGCITGMLSVTRDKDNKAISGTCPGNGVLYYNKAGKLAGCIVPPTKVARAGDTLKPFDISELGKGIKPYKTIVEIPCNTKIAGGACPVADNPAGYIARLYQFGLMIVGLAALGAIIFGAARYTLSAGNFANKEDAKDQMLQAIFGLLLLLSAYLILYTINPKLVTLINPAAEPINLDTLLPPEKIEVQVPGVTPSTNTPAESSGGQIEGCARRSSSALGDFTTVNVNGEQIVSTGGAGLECKECMAGNDLADGKCNCKTGLTRRFNGMCCLPTRVVYQGTCTLCGDFKNLLPAEFNKALSDRSKEEQDEIRKICDIHY